MAYRIMVALQHSTYGGVYYANDFDYSGSQPTWSRLSIAGLSNLLLDQLQIDHSDPYNIFYVQLQNGEIYKWTGAGFALIMDTATARTTTGEAGGAGEDLDGISTDSTVPGRIYATYTSEVGAGTTAYVLKSDDYGNSWSSSPVSNCCLGTAEIVRVQGNHIWVGGSDAYGCLFYSDDNGTNWYRDAEWVTSSNSIDPKINPDFPNKVYINRHATVPDFDDLGSVVYSAGFASSLLQSNLATCWYINPTSDGSTSDVLWIDPENSNHQRVLAHGSSSTKISLYATVDGWGTTSFSPSDMVFSPDPALGYAGCIASPVVDNTLIAFSTIQGRNGVNSRPLVWALSGETSNSPVHKSGDNYNVAPYENSLPSPSGSTVYVIRDGIYIGDPVAQPCYIAAPTNYSIAANYQIRLKDTTGATVAIFDNWESLSFTKTVNDVWSYELAFADNGDERFNLFEIDGQVEVWRRISGLSVPWYAEFRGFHRKAEYRTDQDGRVQYVSSGVGFNDLLARTQIAYVAGTIQSDKDSVAETAMKEYVYENCGAGALYVNGRERDGVLPGFTVDASGGAGDNWEGSRSFEGLLDVLQDIANQSEIDFQVEWNGDAQFVFRTYAGQLGSDRTTAGLDPITGVNAAGNVPVVFNVMLGNIQSITYSDDHSAEANIVYVLGAGDGATRDIVVREDAAGVNTSPWNRREISRPGSNQEFTFQLEELGDEVLKEMQAKDVFEFEPLQQPSTMYGKHYFLGDKCTIKHRDIEQDIRVTQAQITVANQGEQISLTMSVIPQQKK